MSTPAAEYQYDKKKQISVLSMNTLAFTVNFAVWTMFSVIGIKIKGELELSETEFGLLIATPILTGSLSRLPLGFLTDRFGGRGCHRPVAGRKYHRARGGRGNLPTVLL